MPLKQADLRKSAGEAGEGEGGLHFVIRNRTDADEEAVADGPGASASASASANAVVSTSTWGPWKRGLDELSGGQRTLLLTEPMPYPPGWSPRVHDVSEPEELRKRALEASRIAPGDLAGSICTHLTLCHRRRRFLVRCWMPLRMASTLVRMSL